MDLNTPIQQTLQTIPFLTDILSNQYILILGSSVMLQEAYADGDVNKWLLREIGCKSFNVADRETVYRALSPYQKEYDKDKLNKNLKTFLKWANFRMVFTTTVDPFAELLMDEVWGRGKYDIVVYGEDSFRSLCDNIRNSWESSVYRYDRPTLVYVFGKPKYLSRTEGDSTASFLYNDETAIGYMCRWMLEMQSNDAFKGFVESKKILSLGCNFDNWYFRFFWHIMTRSEHKDAPSKGIIGIKLDDENTSERRLAHYLKANTYVHVSQTPNEFLKKYNDEILCNKTLIHEIADRQRRPGLVFISYCSKNKQTALDLFLKLTKRGYNVWLDKVRLITENSFEAGIEKGIYEAQTILLLLSPEIADDLESGRYKETYYFKEWLMALGALQGSEELKLIKPLAVNGYDPHAAYHTNTFTKTMGPLSAIDYAEHGSFELLLAAIDEIQKKNEYQKHKDDEKR